MFTEKHRQIQFVNSALQKAEVNIETQLLPRLGSDIHVHKCRHH